MLVLNGVPKKGKEVAVFQARKVFFLAELLTHQCSTNSIASPVLGSAQISEGRHAIGHIRPQAIIINEGK